MRWKWILALVAVILTIIAVFAAWKGMHMYLPKLNEISRERTVLSTFGGLDHRAKTPEGFFYDSNNLTSDHYPLMATRAKQSYVHNTEDKLDCILVADTLYFTRGNTLYSWVAEDDEFADHFIFGEYGETAKQIARFGAYIIILRNDGKIAYYNTVINGDCGVIDRYTIIGDAIYYATDKSGNRPRQSATAPTDAQNGDLWHKTADSEELKKGLYRYTDSEWHPIYEVYTAIMYDGIDISNIKIGDMLRVEGVAYAPYSDMNKNDYRVININNSTIVLNYDPVSSYGEYIQDSASVILKFVIYEFDYICSVNNRLWGCRYDGNVNTIYASKLGSIRIWNDYETIADSSYAVSLGSAGAFTGAASYQGYPIFFKENYIHRIAGTLPENFTLQTTECQGVKEGSHRSVTVSNDRLYFHGIGGVYAYDGNLPVKISDELGASNFSNATGVVHDNKLYMNMSDGGVYATYVYDLSLGLWHKQNEGLTVNGFASYKDDMLCTTDQGILSWYGKSVFTGYELQKLPFTWYAETGIIGTDAPGAKYLARMIIRMSMELDATMTIYVEYDSIPEWIPLTTISGDTLQSFSIPLSFDRCDHLRLRFEGTGEAKIYTITKDIEKGGEER